MPLQAADTSAIDQRIATAEKQLDTTQQQQATQKEAELGGLEKQLGAAEAAPLPTRPQIPIPQSPQQKPPVDAKEYQNFASAITAMAMIAGVAGGRERWTNVLTSLNGALSGYLEGSQEKAQQEYANFDRQFKEAMSKQQQANEEFNDILNQRNKSINQIMTEYRIAAAKWGRADAQQAAEERRIDKMYQSKQQYEIAHDRLAQQHENMAQRMEMTMLIHGLMRGVGGAIVPNPNAPPGKNALTPEGAQWLAEYTRITGQTPSLWGGKAQIFNMLAQQDVSPADVASNKSEYAAIGSALRQTEVRQAGVERLTESVKQIEPQIMAVARRTGLSDTSLINTPLNKLRSKLGDADLAELKVLVTAANRQYIEAVTMPGSNAQMHTTSQQTAEELLNSDMSLGQMFGAFKGINFDISAGHLALTGISKTLRNRIKDNGLKIKPELREEAAPLPGQGSAPASLKPPLPSNKDFSHLWN